MKFFLGPRLLCLITFTLSLCFAGSALSMWSFAHVARKTRASLQLPKRTWGIPLTLLCGAAVYSASGNKHDIDIRMNNLDIKEKTIAFTNEYEISSSPELGDFMKLEEFIKLYETPQIRDAKILVSSEAQLFKDSQPGLSGALFKAYSEHRAIALRPDDIWLTLISALAHYNASQGEHRDKLKLTIELEGSLDNADEKFLKEFTQQIIEEIDSKTDKKLTDWLAPNFTTTTERDRLVGRIMTMGSLEKYFYYEGILSCALTRLTLKGTLEDWQKLASDAENFKKLGGDFVSWSELLKPVLDEFVSLYQGDINEEFWQKMITAKRFGSGSQKVYQGWFAVFSPFDHEGDYRLNSKEEVEKTGIYATMLKSEMLPATVIIPVHFNDNGRERDALLLGGLTGIAYDELSKSIRPSIDFALIEPVPVQKIEK